MEDTGVSPDRITAFCFPAAAGRTATALARKLRISEGAVADNLQAEVGEAGAAHPLVMLVSALQSAKPGDLILVTGFGQGQQGDVLADGRVEGVLRESLEQVVIGSDPYFLKRSPKLEPDPERSRFSLTPVPDDATCESLLGADAPGSTGANGEPGAS